MLAKEGGGTTMEEEEDVAEATDETTPRDKTLETLQMMTPLKIIHNKDAGTQINNDKI
jgi:hypothetical protein